MNTKKLEDGGPAFPCNEAWYNREKNTYEPVGPSGMTLRDYFAAAALTGWCGSQVTVRGEMLNDSDEHATILSSTCFKIADAMLAARKSKGTP